MAGKENNSITILYEDKHMLVLDKPAGVVVNRAETVRGKTIQDWMEEKFKTNETKGEGYDEVTFRKRSGVAHRLDKETSGCLVAAKTPEALAGILKAFKERKVKKHYLAVVHGRLEPLRGTVRLPMARSRKERQMWQVHYEGKAAETSWRVEKFFTKNGEEYSLVSLYPKTGRTHQIRVHMAFLKHPLAGDDKYLNRQKAEKDRQEAGRLMLHARGIELTEPLSGEKVNIESPLPEDFKKFTEE